MRLRGRAAVVLATASALGFTMTGSGPAPASTSVSAAGAAASCFHPGGAGAARLKHGHGEENLVDAAYERALARGEGAADHSDAHAAAVPLHIPVHVHVIQPSVGVGDVSDSVIASQIQVLNNAYAGVGNLGVGSGAVTSVSFTLASVDRTVNAAWYPTTYGSASSIAIANALHTGGKRDLNLYLDQLTGFYGWATFPDTYATAPTQDGIFIDNQTVPGGSSPGFGMGFTAAHESGHWLGLFHTFQGGCGGGDLVSDTAPEASPASGCPTGRDTCASDPLPDPIHNFMDYSDDACLYEFTPGQADRIQDQTAAFRNSPPTISGATLTTTAQTAVSFSPATSDPEGDAVTISVQTAPAHGTATVSQGSVTYTSAPTFGGQDQFTIVATDAFGAAAVAVPVVVNVSPDQSVSLTVVAGAKQKAKNLAIAAGCGGEACTLSVTGTITLKGKVHGRKKTKTFKLVPATASASSGGQATLHLTVTGAKKLTKLLKAGWKGTATATVEATDAAGNTATRTSTVKLKR